MKTSMFCIAALIFLLSYVSTFDLRNKTACFPYPLIVDPPCKNTEMLLPRNFILATFTNKTCQGKIGNNVQSHHDDIIPIIKYCCQLHLNDQLTEYCLPSRKSDIKYKGYKELIDKCTGRQGCSLVGNVQTGTDYATLQYQCIPKANVLHITENNSITGKTVSLYNDKLLPTSVIHCIAYSKNCEANLTVKLVAIDIPDNKCSITYSENNNQSTFNCFNIDQHGGGCQQAYRSTSNCVDVRIQMVIHISSRLLLWVEVEATSENVTVACGDGIPADVPKGCTTTSKTATSTSPMVASLKFTTNHSRIINQLTSQHSVENSSVLSTNAGQETTSNTDVLASTVRFDITIIGTSVGGIAVLLLIGFAFLCYRRRGGISRGKIVKKNSKTEVLRRRISDSERESVTCDNSIYETDDFKLKVRDSMVKDDDKVKCDHPNNRNTDPYATIEGDKPFGTNAGGRIDLGEKPFGTDLKIKRNSWVNSCPDFMSEMAVSQSLAKLDDILNAEESRSNQANDVYANVLRKEEQNKGTRPGNGELSDMYAKVVPKAYR